MSDSSTLEQKRIDFPPLCLLDTLVRSFPKNWRGIFAALNSEYRPVQAASFLLQKRTANESLPDIPPNWKDLIDDLLSDYPVVLNDQLFFKSKLFLFPLNIQCNMLAFIFHHICSVPVDSLDKLVQRLRTCKAEIAGWRLTHLRILESKVRSLKGRGDRNSVECCEEGNTFKSSSLITRESNTRFEDLIEKSKLTESSRKIPWLSSFIECETHHNDNTLGDISKQQVSALESKSAAEYDVDMIDFTNMYSDHEYASSNKTLQEFHRKSSDVSGDSDIEIIEVDENSVQLVKLEPETTAIKGFTVPPPPEQLIPEQFVMISENVPEHLKTNTKDTLEHSSINTRNDPEKFSVKDTEDVPELMITDKNISREPMLCDVLQLKISALQNLLQSSETNELNLPNALQIFSSSSAEELSCICTQLNLKNLEESAAISLCLQFVSLPTEPSLSSAVIFGAHCLLPKIQQLKQNASRVLFSAISQFAVRHSRAFCDGVIISLIQQSNLDIPQVDLINKIIKECFTEDTRVHLLQLILSVKSDTEGSSISWTESTVSIVQMLIDFKPEFNGDLFECLVCVLEKQSWHLTKSLKFAKMLLAVIKTYGQHVSLHQNSFVYILEANETFLKKAGMSALKKTTSK